MKFLYALILSLATVSLAMSQNTTSDGDWGSSSIWSGGTPGNVSVTDINFTSSPTININNEVSTGNRNITMDNNANVNLNINQGAKLTVEGNYGFSQNGTRTINVIGTPGNFAFLTITGDFLLDGSVTLNIQNAYVRVEGSMTLDSDANANVTVGESGVLFVKEDLILDNNLVGGVFDAEGTILVDGNVDMKGYNNTTMDGVFATLGTLETDIVLQSGDTIEFWGDNIDGNTVQQDNRTNPSFPAGNPAEGTYAEFAARYPNLCYFSDYCKDNYPFNNPLPVTWSDVYVEEALGLVTIYWSTLSETDNDYFEVYKSTDAESWTSIGVVSGAGISKELLSYSLADVETVSEVTYYRVEQVDYDGASEYSKTVVYVPGEGLSSSEGLYPNPNAGSFYVDLGEDELLSVSIASSKGESVAFDYAVLDNLIKVDVDPGYASGFYTVTIITDAGVSQKNFIIK